MKSISVRKLKANWAAVEKQIASGETFEVLNRGKPTAHIVPAKPRRVVVWDDHLATAVRGRGRLAEAVVQADREGRW